MSKPRLIVFEGSDGLGKTTQAKLLIDTLKSKDNTRDTIYLRQPSGENMVSFVRDAAKKNPNFSGFERQLLIACSHIVDAFSSFPQDTNVVMDRSWLSGMVYGRLTGLDEKQHQLLFNILRKVYFENLNDRFDVTVFMVTAEQRFDQADDDVFERSINWKDLRDAYALMATEMATAMDPAFAFNERVVTIDVTGISIEETQKSIQGEIFK